MAVLAIADLTFVYWETITLACPHECIIFRINHTFCTLKFLILWDSRATNKCSQVSKYQAPISNPMMHRASGLFVVYRSSLSAVRSKVPWCFAPLLRSSAILKSCLVHVCRFGSCFANLPTAGWILRCIRHIGKRVHCTVMDTTFWT